MQTLSLSLFSGTLAHPRLQSYTPSRIPFWQLKSRITWLNYGDTNTKFFHLKTLQNRSQSCITTLKDSIGLWVLGDMLITHIRDAFTKNFMSTSPQT